MPILGILASSTPVAAGSFESIATVTVGSGGAANVEFTSIPNTYTHLQIRAFGRTDLNASGANTGTYAIMRFNGETTNTNYSIHRLQGDGSSASAYGATSTNFFERFAKANDTASIFGTIIFDILDYANTNKYKTVRQFGGVDFNGSGVVVLISSLWQSTSAITSIKFTAESSANYVQYSHFALYGIKSA